MNTTQVNLSWWYNSTQDELYTVLEFPPWKLVLSLILVGFWLLLVVPTTLITSSLLVAVKNSSIHKAMALVHTFVLAQNAIVRIASTVSYRQLSGFAPAPLQLARQYFSFTCSLSAISHICLRVLQYFNC